MGETIQTFVERIRSEGVAAGQKEADGLLSKARQEGEAILAQARKEREEILAEAKSEAQGMISRAQTELQLAARDAAMKLRDALTQAVRQVLTQGVREKLTDTDFVGGVLHEIVTAFGKQEFEGKRTFRINVPEEMRQQLVEWAMSHIGQEAIDGSHLGIDLKGTLQQAGFEYNATGATVEVTLDSVVEVLTELVGPNLREILREALAGEKG
jgi:vacuolar-type H+-ATPase subunit H